MKIACLCPVYGNPPHILEETVQCFLAQTYPDKELILFDDFGNLKNLQQPHKQVKILSTNIRVSCLIQKYIVLINLLTHMDAFCIWDADDLYLPDHLQRHVELLDDCAEASYPKQVWSTYTGSPQKEDTGGRFWASLAFTAKRVRERPLLITDKACFDQMNLKRLLVDGYCSGPPTYCFRWLDTEATHVQTEMRSPDDESWYSNYKPHYPFEIFRLEPGFRPQTRIHMEHMIDANRTGT